MNLFHYVYHVEISHRENTQTMYSNDILFHIQQMMDSYITGRHNADIDAILNAGKNKKPNVTANDKYRDGETFLTSLRTPRWKEAMGEVGKHTQTSKGQKLKDAMQETENMISRIKQMTAANNVGEA